MSGTFPGLQVLDRLEIGPARVEKNRLTAPYRVFSQGREEVTRFIARYQEPVFDSSEPESRNLAGMIAVQVALNYGLFCKEIHFHGHFDRVDRRFISRAMENTAREIYVKKLLEPNPFLVPTFPRLPALPQRRFSGAALSFDAEPLAGLTPWEVSTSRHAILSSGGKDSLLSFGLLRELGAETHPVFGNESGRHWYTALNAYRHFRANVPNTSRVWMNSDRVFSWMLRRLPLIRQDFARMRSDEYPIRLWTVAVFLFSTLPLVRKRGIGRLVIGDEFDTTRRVAFQKIPHYDGLYDQSRFFDQFMTRYFRDKGWDVHQFSLLRALSEFLIQKILAERYPELLARQVSCHAAHIQGDRVKPCGRCEKCRRIVAMLAGLGIDPAVCGYGSEDIRRSLAEFSARGIHQEKAGMRYLEWLLAERGLIGPAPPQGPQPHPEVASLRFDRTHSPPDLLPPELRHPLFRIFLEHAAGALRREGSTWKKFDPISDPGGP